MTGFEQKNDPRESGHYMPLVYRLVGNEGFEPPMPDSESGALPLGEFPTAQVSVANFRFLQVLSSAITSIFYCQ